MTGAVPYGLKQAILKAVRKAAWRGEISLCREFAFSDSSPRVEDALFELVREKKIEWFGSNDRPLRYRRVTKGKR